MGPIQEQQVTKKRSLERLARFSRVHFENQVFVQPKTLTKKSGMASTKVSPPDSDLFAFKQRVLPKMSEEMKNVMSTFNMIHLTPRDSTNAIAEDDEDEALKISQMTRRPKRNSEAYFQNRLEVRRKQSMFNKLPKLPSRKSLHSVTNLAANVHTATDKWRPRKTAWSESPSKELQRSVSDDLYSSRTRQLLERSSYVYNRIDDLQKRMRSASLDSPFEDVVSLDGTREISPRIVHYRSGSALSNYRRDVIPKIEVGRDRSGIAPSEYSYDISPRNQSSSYGRLAAARASKESITGSLKQLSLDDNATEMNLRRKEHGFLLSDDDISIKINRYRRRRSQTIS